MLTQIFMACLLVVVTVAMHAVGFDLLLRVIVRSHALAKTGFRPVTGLVIGLFEFVLFWVLTGYYVIRANSEFDALTEALLRESMKAKK